MFTCLLIYSFIYIYYYYYILVIQNILDAIFEDIVKLVILHTKSEKKKEKKNCG